MLLQNYNVFNANPGHAVGGPTDPRIWYKAGSVQGFYAGAAEVAGQTEKDSFPSGYAPPYSYILAPVAGGMSSRFNASISFSPAGAIAGGLPAAASATITLTPAATGGLIVSGSGSATITFAPTATIISVAAGSGSATITLSPAAAIGAVAYMSGTSGITFSPTVISYAIGYLSGTSTSETEFSPEALARAVWEALAVDFNTAGTMGEKLNSASSAGDPWGTALPGIYADGTAGKIVGEKLLTTIKFLGLK